MDQKGAALIGDIGAQGGEIGYCGYTSRRLGLEGLNGISLRTGHWT